MRTLRLGLSRSLKAQTPAELPELSSLTVATELYFQRLSTLICKVRVKIIHNSIGITHTQ